MQKQGGGTYNNNNKWGNQFVNIDCDSNGNLKIIEDLCWDKFSTINAWKKKFPNAKTFPQIIINQKHIGGYFELKKWLDQNSFDEDF